MVGEGGKPAGRVPHREGASAGRGEDVGGRARPGARGAVWGSVLPHVVVRLRVSDGVEGRVVVVVIVKCYSKKWTLLSR